MFSSNQFQSSTLQDVDARITEANQRMSQEIARLQSQHEEALALIARKEALVARLESFLHEVQSEKSEIQAREKLLHQSITTKHSAKIAPAKAPSIR